ncbi:MAG TPA: DUF6178 family protein [Polyangia bacterium]|nr:DUF6178 family protein [Polyangia bacterium]
MTFLSRRPGPPSTELLTRILERPGLAAAVRDLPAPVLGKLIDRIGLEDAGELIALATPEQLARIFDDDLWRADRAAGDETFRPERFALWLQVMREAGEEALVQRLCELPQDLVALAVHRLVLVLDMDVLAEQVAEAGEEGAAIERALEDAAFEEWEELRVIARDPDVWDDIWGALLALDRDHHDRLRAILEQCCAMSTEYISGQGGLYQVLTSAQMLESDVAAGRDDRRASEGFVSPADARAFLALARRTDADDRRDPITEAYFRQMRPVPQAPTKNDLMPLLQELDVVAPAAGQGLAALAAGEGAVSPSEHLAAPLFEQAMRALRDDAPAAFSDRLRELGYLVNVWMAGGVHEGRPPRPLEALETVLRVCEAGLRTRLVTGRPAPEQARAILARTPADRLFRWGTPA